MTSSLLGLVVGAVGAGSALLLPPAYGILAVLLVQQMPWGGEIAEVAGVSIRPVDPVMAIWIVRVAQLARRGRLDLRALRTAPILLWAAWLSWLLVATLAAHWRDGDLHGGSQIVSLARLYQMAVIMPLSVVTLSTLSAAQVRTLLRVLVVAVIAQAALAMARWAPLALANLDWIGALGVAPDHEWFYARNPLLAYPVTRGGRWTGSLGDPATLAYFAIASLAALWGLWRPARPTSLWSGVPLVLVVLFSFTRTAWVGLAVLVAAAWTLAKLGATPGLERRSWLFQLATGAALWIALLGAQRLPGLVAPGAAVPASRPGAAVPAPAPILDPETGTPAPEPTPNTESPALLSQLRLEVDSSARGRLLMTRLSLEHFRSHPIVGLGWAGRPLHDDTPSWGESLYSRLLGEAGALGLLLFLAFLAACARAAWTAIGRSAPEECAPWRFGLLGTVAFAALLAGDLLLVGPNLTSALLFFMTGWSAATPRPGVERPWSTG